MRAFFCARDFIKLKQHTYLHTVTDVVNYKLGKKSRIKSYKLIQQIFKEGKSVTAFPIRAVYLRENNKHVLQAAFSVSKSRYKKATDRNRIKRLMREAWRLQKNDLEAALSGSNKQLSVFLSFLDKKMPDYETVVRATEKLLYKLVQISEQNKDSDKK